MASAQTMQLNLAQTHRQLVASALPENATLVLFSGGQKKRNSDVYYPFRPDSYFAWLSGWWEPNAAIILHKESGQARWILAHPGYDPHTVLWHGLGLSHEQTRDNLQVDESIAYNDLNTWMKAHHNHSYPLYIRQQDPLAERLARSLNIQTFDSDPLCMPLRLTKSADEINCVQRAVDISVAAMRYVISRSADWSTERDIAAAFWYRCQRLGAEALAYPIIAAHGDNACTLHYTRNNKSLKAGHCILMDAGCEWLGYAADLTRTWPISGSFSVQQRAIYEAVLHAQETCIQAIRPGVPWRRIQHEAEKVILNALIDLGILRIPREEALREKTYRRFFPHGIGHSLGMDVHDPSPGSAMWTLRENQVLTVEPGLYLPQSDDIDQRFWGIGVRIEDNILVTSSGSTVLSAQLEKECSAVEILAQGR